MSVFCLCVSACSIFRAGIHSSQAAVQFWGVLVKMSKVRGKLFGVGVGPGDPKLITLRAVEVIRFADCIAYPTPGARGDSVGGSLALEIVGEHIRGKELLECLMPMSRDAEYVENKHAECAANIMRLLDEGKNVAFVTLGDPSIYSTYMYIHRRVRVAGYEAQLIPGVTSFCAAAASLGESLCEGAQPLVIIPAGYEVLDRVFEYEGNKVFMKSGRSFGELREKLRENGLLGRAKMVERASLCDEKIYEALDDAKEFPSYFSLIVLKE